MLIKDALEDTELMSDSEKELASFFLQERLDVAALTARQLAASLFVSPSTVTRFCQRLGFSGFPDFKDSFIKEKQYLDQSVKDVDVNKPFKRGDSMWSVANAVRQMYAEVSDNTLGLQDYRDLERANALLDRADRIFIYSSGDHLLMAELFANKMTRVGRLVTVIERTDMMEFQMQHTSEQDVFILISYSGETRSLYRVLDAISRYSVNIIAIISFGKNTLSRAADIVLPISTHERLIQNYGNFSTGIAVSYILDVLYADYVSCHLEAVENKTVIEHRYQEHRFTDNPMIDDE